MAPATSFEGTCPRCAGSGLWQNRAGFECRGCAGTGLVTVAAVRQGAGHEFRVVSAKGNVTKERYYARAELIEPLQRIRCGSTIGSGWWEEKSRVDPVGSTCSVYAVLDDGHLVVRLPGGGYASTKDRGPTRTGIEGTTPKVRVTEYGALEAIRRIGELVAA